MRKLQARSGHWYGAALAGLLLISAGLGCARRQPGPPPVDPQLQETIDRLVVRMRDEDDDEAAAALAAIGAPALPALSEAPRDPDAEFRLSVVEVVEEIGTAEGVDLLLAALDDSSWEVRLEAVEGLGAAGDRRAVEPLMALYRRDEDAQVRYECLTSLGRIGDPAAADFLRNETRNEDPYARGWAIDALCQLGDAEASEEAVRLLRDPSHFVRRQTLRSCKGALNSSEARQRLVHMAIYESDFENSVWARRVLRERRAAAGQGDVIIEEMRQEGLRALQDPEADSAQKLQAALVLGEIGDNRATIYLIAGLEAPNVAERQHAVHVLGEVSDPRAVSALIRALRDPEQLIQATAYDSLQQHARAGDERASAAIREYAGPKFNQPLAR